MKPNNEETMSTFLLTAKVEASSCKKVYNTIKKVY